MNFSVESKIAKTIQHIDNDLNASLRKVWEIGNSFIEKEKNNILLSGLKILKCFEN